MTVEPQDLMDFRVMQELLEHLVILVPREILGLQEAKVQMEPKALLAQLVQWDSLVLLALKDHQDQRVQLEMLEHKVMLVCKVQLAPRDNQDLQDPVEHLALRDLKVQLVHLVMLDLLDQLDQPDHKEPLELLGHLGIEVPQVPKDLLDHQAHKETLVQQVTLACLLLLDFLVTLVQVVLLVCLVLQDQLALLDHVALQVIMANKEMLGFLDPKVSLVRQAILVHLEIWDQLGVQALEEMLE